MQGICSARDIPDPKEDANRPFISFSVTEVISSAATTTLKQEKGTWSFGPSPVTCPWSFAEREKPVVDFGRQSKYDPTFMLNTDGEGGPLYGTALMSSPVPVAYNKASDCSNLVQVLVDSGASDHYLNTRAKRSSSTQEFATTNTPQKHGVSERVGRALCSMVRCVLVDSGLPP